MPESLRAYYCHCKQQIKTNVTGGETTEEKKQFFSQEQGTLCFHCALGPVNFVAGPGEN